MPGAPAGSPSGRRARGMARAVTDVLSVTRGSYLRR